MKIFLGNQLFLQVQKVTMDILDHQDCQETLGLCLDLLVLQDQRFRVNISCPCAICNDQ